jgi:hypothetical protein
MNRGSIGQEISYSTGSVFRKLIVLRPAEIWEGRDKPGIPNLAGAARPIQKPPNEKRPPEGGLPALQILIGSRRRARPRAAAVSSKAQTCEADEQHRPGRRLGNRRFETLGPQSVHRGGWMNVVPIQEAIDVRAIRTACRRRRRAPRRVGEARVGRVRESESRSVSQKARVVIVKVEVGERTAGGERRIEGAQSLAKLRVVQLAKCRGVRSHVRRTILREFRDEPHVGNIHDQKVFGALTRKRRDRRQFGANAVSDGGRAVFDCAVASPASRTRKCVWNHPGRGLGTVRSTHGS